MKRRYSIGYGTFRHWVWIGSRLFYRQFGVRGIENFPSSDQPTLLISNHQNGMMDPIMCCITVRRQLHFLTRADIFRNPLANKVLRSLNMLPVYRAKDRVRNLVEMNEASFKESYNRLLAGNVISVFPEGNHNNKRWLRPFRKGTARVIFGAYELGDFKGDIQIVPVGLDYGDYTQFRDTLFLNFGKPISTADYKESYKTDPAKTLTELTRKAQESLSALMIDIRSKKYYDTIMGLRPALKAIKPAYRASGAFDEFKDFTLKMDDWIGEGGEHIDKLETEVASVEEIIQSSGISARTFWEMEGGINPWFRILGFLALLPISLAGFVLNIIPGLIVHEYVKRQVRDPHFKSSILLAMSLVVFPLFYLFEGAALSLILSSWWWLLIAGLLAPATGLIMAESWRSLQVAREVLSWRKKLKSHDSAAERGLKLRTEIANTIHQILAS